MRTKWSDTMKKELLMQEIQSHDYDLETFAALLNLSTDELEDKMIGFTEFTVDEVQKLKNVLHLSTDTIHTIFFTN